MWTIWSSKGFGFDQHIAEKSTRLLVQATFGHTVGQYIQIVGDGPMDWMELKHTRGDYVNP